MAYNSRDPFARSELHRETVDARNASCSWCGQVRKGGKLYSYRTETDRGSKFVHPGLFCCKGCHDTYYFK